MLRVSRALRILLVVVAIVLLAWLPISFLIGLSVMLPWPAAYSLTSVQCGSVSFSTRDDRTFPPVSARADFYRAPIDEMVASRCLTPRYHRSMFPAQSGGGIAWQTSVNLPLWLLALLCLAWPVTSFLLARRRRGTRGFEVTPSPASDSAAPKGQP